MSGAQFTLWKVSQKSPARAPPTSGPVMKIQRKRYYQMKNLWYVVWTAVVKARPPAIAGLAVE